MRASNEIGLDILCERKKQLKLSVKTRLTKSESPKTIYSKHHSGVEAYKDPAEFTMSIMSKRYIFLS